MSDDREESAYSPAAVLDGLVTAVILARRDGRIVHLNHAAETLLGLSLARAGGRRLGDVVPGTAELLPMIERVCTSGAPLVHRELRLGGPGAVAAPVTVDCSVSPLHSAPGAEVLVELADAGPRARLSRETTLLAQQGVSRTIARQLAHEIRNPLGGLRGAAQLLERELDAPELREYTSVILGEADRLGALLDNMLGPETPPRREEINVHRLLQRVCQLLRAEAPQLGIVEDYDPSLPASEMDGDQVLQALLNLGRNATQALAGEGTLHIRTRALTGISVRGVRCSLVAAIDFEDDGPGVPEDIVDSLFYPLVTGRAGGSGLGLAIAQDLMHRHGGLIELLNERRPTVFRVYLPIDHENGRGS